jgi:uncharacterized protein
MRVVIAGGSGFLGQALAARLAGDGHDVVILTRQVTESTGPGRQVLWRPEGSTPPAREPDTAGTRGVDAGAWAREIDGAGAVVNLTGESLAGRRWSEARKEVLRRSRLLPTRTLVAAIRVAATRPPVLVQASGVNFYGSTGDEVVDESFPPGSDFLARLSVDWEAEARAAEALGCRIVLLRNGVVLGRKGMALRKMIPAFQWFVGGPFGSGRQYLSWIHLDDWTSLVVWAITTPAVSGAVNATAPEPVTNAAFATALGRALHRPSFMRVPAFVLRIAAGEVADLLLEGQRVVPKRALDLGFTFAHPSIDEAMKTALKK